MTEKNTERRAFLILLLFLVAAGVYVLKPFLFTLITALVLVILFYPLYKKILRWTKGRQNLSAALSILSVLFLLILPITIILTLVTGQIAGAIQHLPAMTSREALQKFLADWYVHVEPLVAKFETMTGIKLDLLGLGWKGVQQFVEAFAHYSPAVIAGTANFFINFFIMLVVMFYLFRDGDQIYRTFIALSPVKDQYEDSLAEEIKETIYGVFYGSFLTSLVQAVLATVGYWIAGINEVLVWGTLTFFISFIPIIGTAGILIPLVFILFVQGKTYHAVFLLAYGAVVIGSADNLLKPILIKSNMHPLLLFLSIFGGLAVFGPMGLLLGPILLGLSTATAKIYLRDFKSA